MGLDSQLYLLLHSIFFFVFISILYKNFFFWFFCLDYGASIRDEGAFLLHGLSLFWSSWLHYLVCRRGVERSSWSWPLCRAPIMWSSIPAMQVSRTDILFKKSSRRWRRTDPLMRREEEATRVSPEDPKVWDSLHGIRLIMRCACHLGLESTVSVMSSVFKHTTNECNPFYFFLFFSE